MLLVVAQPTHEAYAQQGGVELAAGSRVVVRLPENASDAERFAGDEFTTYLQRMIGVEVTRESASQGSSAKNEALVVEIGATPANRQLRESMSTHVTGPGADSFAVVQEGRRLQLVGGADRGTLYAVYDWLEEHGCRWFAPGREGEVVPRLEHLVLAPQSRYEVPANITREIGGDAGTFDPWAFLLWQTRNRINRSFAMRDGYLQRKYPGHAELQNAWARLGGMEQWQWIAHNFSFMFDDLSAAFQEHPEYFALYNGKRIAPGSPGRPGYGGGNLALTNPDVVAHCAAFAIQWFDQHPQGTVVPMWPGDGAIKWDESPQALALGGRNFTTGPEGSMTRRMVTFVNAVARRVAKAHPDRLLLLPAYQNYIEPIDDIEIEPNVFVQYCYHGDYAHGPLNSPVNKASADQMRRWADKVPGRFGVWEYFLIGDHTLTEAQPVLLPLVYRVRDTMQFLDSIGSTRYFTQSSTVYQPYNPLLYYALARYMWDPSLDADALIRDYSLHAFGPEAGEPIARFYIQLERYTEASAWRPQLYPDVSVPSPEVFSEAHVLELQPLLAAAEACTLSPDQRRRLDMLQEAFAFCVANAKTQALAGLSTDQPWRLQRGADAYIMNADAPDVDPSRFDALVRQALDTGQATAKFERLLFRARKRSEPIVAIENESLRAEVLPGLGGRLIRLIDRKTGENFMKESPQGDTLDAVGAGYFNYGGYEEYLGKGFAGPGWEMPFESRVRRTLDGSSIVLEAEHDGVAWTRMYHLRGGPDAGLTIVSTLTNTTDHPLQTSLRTHPQFDVGPGLSDARVAMYTPRAGWVDSPPQAEHDGLTARPSGAWALINPAADRALLHRFDPSAADPYFFYDGTHDYAQLELFGHPITLEPGDSITLTQRIEVGSVSSIQSRMQALDESSVPPAPPPPIEDDQVAPLSGSLQRVPGIVGMAHQRSNRAHELTFDGSLLNPKAGSVEMWVKLPHDPDKQNTAWLLSVGENNPEWLYLVYDKGNLAFCSKSGRAPYTAADMFYCSLSTPAEVADGRWHHVAVVWAQGTAAPGLLRVYIDGQLVESRNDVRLGSMFVAERLRLGGSSATAVENTVCTLDEFRLSNRPKTSADIREAFELGSSRQPLPIDESTALHVDFEGHATLAYPPVLKAEEVDAAIEKLQASERSDTK